MHGSKLGARLFRNNRGLFCTIDIIDKVKALAKSGGAAAVLDFLNSGKIRMTRAGLEVPGSCDLIGWKNITITPDMVGKQVAVFCAPEIKKEGSYASQDQKKFIDNVLKSGGISGIVRSNEDLEAMINAYNPPFPQE